MNNMIVLFVVLTGQFYVKHSKMNVFDRDKHSDNNYMQSWGVLTVSLLAVYPGLF